jgi:hypothetical protein
MQCAFDATSRCERSRRASSGALLSRANVQHDLAHISYMAVNSVASHDRPHALGCTSEDQVARLQVVKV